MRCPLRIKQLVIMDIQHRIRIIEEEIQKLRDRWKEASPPMKIILESEAKAKKKEIRILESVLRRRGELPPKYDPQLKII